MPSGNRSKPALELASSRDLAAAVELGRSRLDAGDTRGAEDLIRRVLSVAPTHAAALHALGVLTVRTQGYTEAAEGLFRRAAAADRHVGAYQRDLAVTLMHRGKLMEAEPPFRRAAQLEPSSAEAQFNIGTLFFRQQRLQDAERALRSAALLEPDNAKYLYTFGRLQHRCRRFGEAEDAYRQSLSLDPNNLDALLSLTNLLKGVGRLGEAETIARKAVQVAPDARRAEALAALAKCHPFHPGDPELSLITDTLAIASGDSRRVLLAMTGKAYEDGGAYDQAFDYYRLAKQAHAEATGKKFKPATWDHLVDSITRAFPGPVARHPSPKSDLVPTPIFIAGLSRSGKSLAESLLAQSPGVFAAGETKFWEAALRTIASRHNITQGYPALMSCLSPDQALEIGEVYLSCMRQLIPSAAWIVETNPGNLLYLGLIFTAFPSARVILCTRDPLDHCLSMYCKPYKRSFTFTYDLGHLAHYYQGYQRLADHWLSLYGDRILTIPYEAMVTDPDATHEQLTRHCGVAPLEGKVHAPFSRQEIGRWRHYAKQLAPLIEALKPVTSHQAPP